MPGLFLRPKQSAIRWIASLALALTGYFCAFSADAREPLMVFAEPALSDALKELAGDFKHEYKVNVVFNFGGSTSLVNQILNGFPCDVFVAADKTSNVVLLSKKFIDREIIAKLLLNRLVVVADVKNPDPLGSLYDIHLSTGELLAIADSQVSSAGVYAMQALSKSDIIKKMELFLLPVADERAALAVVKNGNAKYAIVYATDALNVKNVNRVYLIPAKLHDQILTTAAVIKNGDNLVAARNFLSFLQTAHSKIVFKKYGFQPL